MRRVCVCVPVTVPVRVHSCAPYLVPLGKEDSWFLGHAKGKLSTYALVTLKQNTNHFTMTYNKKYANQVIEGVKTVKKA